MQRVGDRALAQAIDRAAAVLFGAAVAVGAWMVGQTAATWLRMAGAGAAGAMAWVSASLVLRRVAGDVPLFLADFVPADLPVEQAVQDEPDIAAEETAENETVVDQQELLLVDVLQDIEPDARVIRLFDPATMPTAGELKARIDNHLAGGPRAIPDSTEELYAALAALRHSLR